MIKKIFCKYETLFCILLIVLYILINSYCINNLGIFSYKSVIVNTIFSMLLIMLIMALNRRKYYGLSKVYNYRDCLYFIPLILTLSVNFWGGIKIENSVSEIIYYIIFMINVGFIEEIIFRGFLYKMMEQDNKKIAILVCSLTFGIGHIINLFNGAFFIPTLLQVCYATSVGYLFIIIFDKCKSLIPCIITHSLMNASSIFYQDNLFLMYIIPIFLIVVSFGYARYIVKRI